MEWTRVVLSVEQQQQHAPNLPINGLCYTRVVLARAVLATPPSIVAPVLRGPERDRAFNRALC